MKHLFVGGRADGRRAEINGNLKFQRVAIPRSFGPLADSVVGEATSDTVMAETADYVGVKLRAPGREWVVFLSVDLEPDTVVEHLINGYSGVVT